MVGSRIKLVSHPYAWETMQARLDHAEVTGQPLVERPYWYEDTISGRLFHDLFGCVAWPSEVTDSGNVKPGYAAIIGVLRPSDTLEHIPATDAKFILLDEAQSEHVPTLIQACSDLRDKWGYGQRRELLQEFHGDPERFLTVVALRNEQAEHDLLITPPDDWNVPKVFDHYVRSLKSAIYGGRFFFGGLEVLKNRVAAFNRDDPAIMAVGGMVHTLLGRCLWMDQATTSAWRMEDKAIA